MKSMVILLLCEFQYSYVHLNFTYPLEYSSACCILRLSNSGPGHLTHLHWYNVALSQWEKEWTDDVNVNTGIISPNLV